MAAAHPSVIIFIFTQYEHALLPAVSRLAPTLNLYVANEMATVAHCDHFPKQSLQVALASSVSDGSFADTAYYLYSQRLSDWKIGKLVAVYANSEVMKDVSEHLRAHLDGRVSADDQIYVETSDYGYESDSDLDDAEWDEIQEDLKPSHHGQNAATSSTRTDKGKERDRTGGVTPFVSPQCLDSASSQRKYHVVVPHIAVNTWKALVHFIYTGDIHFAPLHSQGFHLRWQATVAHREENPNLPPLCSPKSIYRLANIIGLDSLRDIARQDLQSKINASSVTCEVFSRFSSMYPDILDTELQILYTDALLPQVMPEVLKALPLVVRGDMPYCKNVLSVLMSKLSTLLAPNYVPPPPPESPQVLSPKSVAPLTHARPLQLTTSTTLPLPNSEPATALHPTVEPNTGVPLSLTAQPGSSLLRIDASLFQGSEAVADNAWVVAEDPRPSHTSTQEFSALAPSPLSPPMQPTVSFEKGNGAMVGSSLFLPNSTDAPVPPAASPDNSLLSKEQRRLVMKKKKKKTSSWVFEED